MEYVKVANQYALDVVQGKIVACKWVKLACQKYIDEVKKMKTKDFPYYINQDKANRVCFFVECQKHLKGPKANTPIKLEPWQVFILVNCWGWVWSEGPNKDKRRFRRAYIELPRGSGKSALASALSLYMLAADGESGADVYSAATNREQARIVFDDARHMASSMSPQLARNLGLKIHAHTVLANKNSKFKPLAADAGTLDGLNIHFAVVDELHAHKKRDLWDVLITGAGKRDQSMIFAITTAGFDLSGIGYEMHTYIEKILEKVYEDNSIFGIIYTIDEDDDWTQEKTWMKANPNWDISVNPEHIRGMATEAINNISKQPGFKTKHLNLWLQSQHSFFDISLWEKCIDETLDIEDFKGKECWVGIDLASKNDLTAISLLFRQNKKVYLFAYHYLPELAVYDGRNSQYRGWADQGLIKICPGNIIDFDIIEHDLFEIAKKFNVRSFNIDPFQASQLTQRLQKEIDAKKIIEVPQTAINLSEPTKELDALTRSGNLVYNNAMITWQASNIVCRYDTNDNVKPNKERYEDKIDGIIATVNAMTSMLESSEEYDIDFEKWEWF